MKTIIELGIVIFLLAYSAGKLPTIIKTAKRGQIYLLKERSSSNWGRAWSPK